MYDLTFMGQDYRIEIGSIIEVEDKMRMFGDWVKLCTDEFDVELSKVSHVRGITQFRVEDIIDRDTPIVIPEVVEEKVNLKSMLKADLIEYAKNIGVEVNPKMTKAKIIEAIENN